MAIEYTTWNPADKSVYITLSNGNLTAASSFSWTSVRATVGKSSGKWYWEITINDVTYVTIGVGTAAATLYSYPGSDDYGCGTDRGNIGSTPTGLFTLFGTWFSAPVNGTIISIAIDMDAGEIYTLQEMVHG